MNSQQSNLGKHDIPQWQYDSEKATVLNAIKNRPEIRELVIETLRRSPRKSHTVEDKIANLVDGTIDHKADYLVRFDGSRVKVQEVKFKTDTSREESSISHTSTLFDIYGDEIR